MNVSYRRLFAIVVVVVALDAVVAAAQQTTEQQLRELRDSVNARIDAILASLAPGLTEPAGLQAAIDSAPDGATIYLRRQAIYPGVRLRRDGLRITTQGEHGVGRVTLEQAATFATFEPTGNVPGIEITASRAQVDNVAFRGRTDTHLNCGVADNRQTTRDQQPTGVTLARLYMDGTAGAKRGIGLHCRNAVVRDSVIFGYRIGGQDTQAIGGWNGEGPFRIENNYLEAGGENVMFGGAAPPIVGMVPRNVSILINHFHKDPAWRGARDPRNGLEFTVKNHIEAKVVDGLIIRGNRIEHQWAAGQHYAIMLTPQAQDAANPNCIVANVSIEDNVFVNVSGGIVIRGREQLQTPCLPGSGFVIRRNWIPINRSYNGGSAQGWPFFLSGAPRDVTIEQNTIDTNGNQIVYVEGPNIFGFRFAGNLVVRSGLYGFSGNGSHFATNLESYLPGAVISGNAFGSFPRPANLPGNLHLPTATIAPLVIDGYGTGDVAAYGRPR